MGTQQVGVGHGRDQAPPGNSPTPAVGARFDQQRTAARREASLASGGRRALGRPTSRSASSRPLPTRRAAAAGGVDWEPAAGRCGRPAGATSDGVRPANRHRRAACTTTRAPHRGGPRYLAASANMASKRCRSRCPWPRTKMKWSVKTPPTPQDIRRRQVPGGRNSPTPKAPPAAAGRWGQVSPMRAAVVRLSISTTERRARQRDRRRRAGGPPPTTTASHSGHGG
jgi:hypothetical protein